jgi:hypothetical protein
MARSRNTADTQTASGGPVSPSIAGKNAIINGGMDVWQRGTTSGSITTANTYTADRWQCVSGASTAFTVSRQATGDTTNLPFIQYCARVQRTASQTGTSVINTFQSFESASSIPFAGKIVTISFYARKGANYSEASSYLYSALYTGTGSDQNILTGFTGSTNVYQTPVVLTTTWQKFTITTTALASTATQLALGFLYSPTGTAGANDYFEVTGVQLEVGSVATPFSRAGGTIQGELAACQRYYYRNANGSTYNPYGVGISQSTSQSYIFVNLPVAMRIAPTSIDYSTLGITDNTVYQLALSNLTLTYASPTSVTLQATTAASQIQYRPAQLTNQNSTSGYLGFTAEL